MSDTAPVTVNTFLIGAQKSGTTFLASLLDQSPDVCVSRPKEPRFFSRPEADDLAYYAGCFQDKTAKILLDASTTYTFLRPRYALDASDAPGLTVPVPQRLYDHAPDARLIYILRDPVARAASAYRHHARTKPPVDGPVSLIERMRIDPMLELIGRYADQIERYLEVFEREQMLFIDFAELTRDPEAVVARTCVFLGVSPGSISVAQDTEKKHSAHGLTFLGRLASNTNRLFPKTVGHIRRAVPRWLQRGIVSRVKTETKVVFSDEAEVARLYVDDRARVKALTGLDI